MRKRIGVERENQRAKGRERERERWTEMTGKTGQRGGGLEDIREELWRLGDGDGGGGTGGDGLLPGLWGGSGGVAPIQTHLEKSQLLFFSQHFKSERVLAHLTHHFAK